MNDSEQLAAVLARVLALVALIGGCGLLTFVAFDVTPLQAALVLVGASLVAVAATELS